MKIYQVGGAVRDKLMHRTPQDIDYVVVSSSPEEMLNAGFKQVGKNFPVFIHPHNKCEYALARKEIKIGNKHSDFKFIFDKSVTLEEDLSRRDFTCNAIALDEETSQTIDIFDGINDIKNKILRHINSEHFIEDPLRILRMCRFAAQLNFNIAPETMTLTKNMVSDGLLQYLSPERIWQEIFKALQTSNFEIFIDTAQQCGALQQIFPETVSYNFKSLSMLALKQVKKTNPIVKFAVFILCINYPILLNENKNSEKIETIKQICSRLKVPNNYKKFAVLCSQYYPYFSNIQKLNNEELINLIEKTNKCTTTNFIDVCRAYEIGQSKIFSENEFQQKVQILKTLNNALSQFKTSTIPNFNYIPKNQNIAIEVKKAKIKIIKNILNNMNT